ncbi:MAG: HAD family hydrolase [Hyphomicrobiales bacterium]
MEIHGILFDKDGTLIDFSATWVPVLKALAIEFANGHQPTAAELLAIAGYDAERDTIRAGSIWAGGTSRELAAAWRPGMPADEVDALTAAVDRFCQAHGPLSAVPLAELRPLFEALRADGLKLGIATNDSERTARVTAKNLGVDDMFELILGYDSVVNPKPAADMVHAFCAVTGLAPETIAVVGDNVHDIEMARAAGAGLAIGVLSGNSSHEDLAPHADHVIDSVADLPRLLIHIRGG